MIKIKKILFPIIAVISFSSCNNAGSDDKEKKDSTEPTTTRSTRENCPNPNGSDLRVALKAQEANFWCWAASGEMVIESLRGDITQCDEANKQFGRMDCCNSPTPDSCDGGGWPQFNSYGFSADSTINQELSWDEIKNQIDCKKTPICATWKWIEGGGHMMVVSGYKTDDGDNWVRILDPLPVSVGSSRWIRYSEYASGRDHTHWDDFYNIRRN